jgi:hypothetical protein
MLCLDFYVKLVIFIPDLVAFRIGGGYFRTLSVSILCGVD